MQDAPDNSAVLKKYLQNVVKVLAGLAVVTIGVIIVLLWTETVLWAEIVGFVDWLSRATAFGTAFAGLAALAAALVAYLGVYKTVHAADEREKETRDKIDVRERDHQELIDTRERETFRHERFTTIVTQLASTEETIRLGGLFAVSALADEWEREARRIIQKLDSPLAIQWAQYQEDWQNSLHSYFQVCKDVGLRQMHEMTTGSEHPQIKEAKQRAIASRNLYILNRKTAPPQIRDAVAQRDACLSLVTANLRGTAVKGENYTSTRQEQDNQQAQPTSPKDAISLRMASFERGQNNLVWKTAMDIVRDHTRIEAMYPWPSRQIDLRGAYLEGADLVKAHLEGAFLGKVQLKGALLMETHLEGAKLGEAHLEDAFLWDAHLENSILEDAHLEGADLKQAHMGGANMRGAYLHGADLFGTHLESADLHGAHLEGVDLRSAHLGSIEDGDVVCLALYNYRTKKVISAHWNDETRWPPNFSPERVVENQLSKK